MGQQYYYYLHDSTKMAKRTIRRVVGIIVAAPADDAVVDFSGPDASAAISWAEALWEDISIATISKNKIKQGFIKHYAVDINHLC